MKNQQASLNRNVVITGFTSFFTDVSSKMVYPLLQGFISTVMRGQAAMLGPVLGIIEGIAESTASLLKVFSGYRSDKKQRLGCKFHYKELFIPLSIAGCPFPPAFPHPGRSS